MDPKLNYKKHIAERASKSLQAAMALRRLRAISPATTRQLFGATVAPVMDYASNVWIHACDKKTLTNMNRVQKIGAQAITGCFRTVATAVGEAESSIRTIHEQHVEKAVQFWTNITTLPRNHPLSRVASGRECKRFTSPLQKIRKTVKNISVGRMETIQPYNVPPWEPRTLIKELNKDLLIDSGSARFQIAIATTSSVRNNRVKIGVTIQGLLPPGNPPITLSQTTGWRHEQNPYSAELDAIT